MVLQALKRFDSYLEKEKPEAERRLSEATVLEYATQKYQEGGGTLSKDDLNPAFVKVADAWFVGDDETFDFDALDQTAVKEYFDLE
jgi:hypothetical protein